MFFAPAQVRQYITADARAYEGPAISSHRLAQLRADPPERHIDPGGVEGSVYRNPSLGFSYQVPSGWFVEPQGAVLPAIERARASDSFAALGRRCTQCGRCGTPTDEGVQPDPIFVVGEATGTGRTDFLR